MNVQSVAAKAISSTAVQASWVVSNVTCSVYAYKVNYHVSGEAFDGR